MALAEPVIFPFGDTVTLIRRTSTARDADGNRIPVETSTALLGAYAPGGSTEAVQGQDLIIMQPTVYLPAGTDVTAIDAVLVAGQRFEVDGAPNHWSSPFTGWAPGVEVKLRKVTG